MILRSHAKRNNNGNTPAPRQKPAPRRRFLRNGGTAGRSKCHQHPVTRERRNGWLTGSGSPTQPGKPNQPDQQRLQGVWCKQFSKVFVSARATDHLRLQCTLRAQLRCKLGKAVRICGPCVTLPPVCTCVRIPKTNRHIIIVVTGVSFKKVSAWPFHLNLPPSPRLRLQCALRTQLRCLLGLQKNIPYRKSNFSVSRRR